PAVSPGLRCETSTHVVAEQVGPKVRWVRVLRACSTFESTRAVVSRRNPGRVVIDQWSLSGLWFHCQASGRAGSPGLRSNSSEATLQNYEPAAFEPIFGRATLLASWTMTRLTPPAFSPEKSGLSSTSRRSPAPAIMKTRLPSNTSELS